MQNRYSLTIIILLVVVLIGIFKTRKDIKELDQKITEYFEPALPTFEIEEYFKQDGRH